MNYANNVQYTDYFYHKGNILLAMEFIEGQNLRKIINTKEQKKIFCVNLFTLFYLIDF
jgi:predicted Ser/Thr protein kinase